MAVFHDRVGSREGNFAEGLTDEPQANPSAASRWSSSPTSSPKRPRTSANSAPARRRTPKGGPKATKAPASTAWYVPLPVETPPRAPSLRKGTSTWEMPPSALPLRPPSLHSAVEDRRDGRGVAKAAVNVLTRDAGADPELHDPRRGFPERRRHGQHEHLRDEDLRGRERHAQARRRGPAQYGGTSPEPPSLPVWVPATRARALSCSPPRHAAAHVVASPWIPRCLSPSSPSSC